MRTFALCLLCTVFQYTWAQTKVEADNPFIKYMGRIDISNPKCPAFSYSGISIKASFTGTSIMMEMENLSYENYYYIIVDHNPPYKLRVTKPVKEYNLAKGLKDTIHDVEIIKITECFVGRSVFKGFILDNWKTLLALPKGPERKILFIGNSITCGFGIEAQDEKEHFSTITENHYLTYSAITARNLGAEYIAVCKSGIGIYRNYGDSITGSYSCMPNIYDGIFYDSLKPVWDPGRFVPEVIIINLNTNDLWDKRLDTVIFRNNYIKFITKLQGYYPYAKIVLIAGPMISDNELVTCQNIFSDIKNYCIRNNNLNLCIFNLPKEWKLGFGADYHPSVLQSKKYAEELTSFLCSLMNWQL